MSSLRIALNNPPEFYTNLDPVAGRVILHLSRTEGIGAVIVKLEGESKTALLNPFDAQGAGSLEREYHKILYKVQQIFPDEGTGPYILQPGQYEWPFRFKIPFNNACSDVAGMARMGGLVGVGGFGSGIRVMDGSKQVFLQHAKKTLPPSLTGFPGKAEIRYYLKVTIQRPGLLKENWRYQIGLRFMPIEEPRPKKTSAEAYARRPFTFRSRSPAPTGKRKTNFLGKDRRSEEDSVVPPSVEMSAFLPFPSILTCNSPIPLRLVAKKKAPSTQEVYLTALQIDLIGKTNIRSHHVKEQLINRWVVVSSDKLHIPLTNKPDDEVESEAVVPDDLWRNAPLPNTVCPAFVTCNLSRTYELEVKLALSWGSKPPNKGIGSGKEKYQPQTIHLPLHFSDVKVFSGIAPPPEVLNAIQNRLPNISQPPASPVSPRPAAPGAGQPPQLPPRRNMAPNSSATPVVPQQPVYDPLYPPQIGAPGSQMYDEAPPSYDEAMAEMATGPVDGLRPRPAYSGVTTDVDGPSQIPA